MIFMTSILGKFAQTPTFVIANSFTPNRWLKLTRLVHFIIYKLIAEEL